MAPLPLALETAAMAPLPLALEKAAMTPLPLALETAAMTPLPLALETAAMTPLPLALETAAMTPLPLALETAAMTPLPLALETAAMTPLPLALETAAMTPLPLALETAAMAPLPLALEKAAMTPLPLALETAAMAPLPLALEKAAMTPPLRGDRILPPWRMWVLSHPCWMLRLLPLLPWRGLVRCHVPDLTNREAPLLTLQAGEADVQRGKDELLRLVHLWNIHRIRPTRNAVAPDGRPVLMHNLPHLYAARNYSNAITNQQLRACREECLPKGPYPCDETVFELSCFIMGENNLTTPTNPDEAIELYLFLRNYIHTQL
ncbi:UNVERIFIED_CONTAM: hypothetical protein FKN15_047457 [Acipenser sinensis]